MKTILYYCTRFQFLKLYGPVIAAQQRLFPETKAVIFIHQGQDTKKHIVATKENMRCVDWMFTDVDVVESETIDAVISHYEVKALVAVGVGTFLSKEKVKELRKQGIKFCALGHIGDEILHILMLGSQVMEEWDVITTLSEYWLEVLFSAGKGKVDEQLARKKIKPVGYVELDQIKDFQAESIRKKYGLPSDKTIIYLSTAPVFWNLSKKDKALLQNPFRASTSLAAKAITFFLQPYLRSRQMEQLVSYRKILSRLRAAAPKEKFFILAKTRGKHNDPSYVKEYVDLVVEEGDGADFYPFKTLELMYICDCYVGFHSASVIETVFLKKFSVSLMPIPDELYDQKVEYPLQQMIFHNILWKRPGACVGYRIYRQQEWQEFQEFLQKISLVEFDESKRREIVTKTVGYDDFSSGDRFITVVMEMIDEKVEVGR